MWVEAAELCPLLFLEDLDAVGALVDFLDDLEDLAAGDLGEYFDQSLSEAFGTFGAVLDAEYVAIAGGNPSPLALPQSTTPEDTE